MHQQKWEVECADCRAKGLVLASVESKGESQQMMEHPDPVGKFVT